MINVFVFVFVVAIWTISCVLLACGIIPIVGTYMWHVFKLIDSCLCLSCLIFNMLHPCVFAINFSAYFPFCLPYTYCHFILIAYWECLYCLMCLGFVFVCLLCILRYLYIRLFWFIVSSFFWFNHLFNWID